MILINIKKEKKYFRLQYIHTEIIWMECKKLKMELHLLSILLSVINFDNYL
jgi:hypothetical protein